MDYKRIFEEWCLSAEYLYGKMSFIAGPRQIGKTTLIERFLVNTGFEGNYFNWDIIDVRRRFSTNPTFFLEELGPLDANTLAKPWVAFDEIHKYPNWKNILKGYFDEFKGKINFVIGGSARLDLFRTSGDSLVGRYFLNKMFPLGPKEVLNKSVDIKNVWHPKNKSLQIEKSDLELYDAVDTLISTGGFPEPFSIAREEFSTRWRNTHISLIVDEDLKDLTNISQIKKVETLVFLLPERIGSPLSLNSLKNTLECAHSTVQLWLEALNKVYLTFSLSPWTKKLARSVLKEKKYYFWDWGMVKSKGPRFENFIAVSLMRSISAWNELGLGNYQLYYVRTKDGLEADFLISDGDRPYLLIECKESETALSNSLPKLKEKTGAKWALQVVNKTEISKQIKPDIFVIGVDSLLSVLL